MTPPKVFVLDPDPVERNWIAAALAPAAGSVAFLGRVEDVLHQCSGAGEACVIAFADQDAAGAVELVRSLRGAGCAIPAIILGPHSAFRSAIDIARLDATDFLERPVTERQLRAAVDRACRVLPAA
jgi:FixJ family two-component response regulator